MSTIHYENIQIEGVPFRKIKTLEIKHALNQHGEANITGLIPTKDANDFMERTDETSLIVIKVNAKDQPEELFVGTIAQITLKRENDFCEMTITLKTISANIDIQRKNRSFQQTTMMYSTLFKEVLQGRGLVTLLVPDKPIGELIMQYNETDFEFIARLSSQLGSVVVSNILSRKIHLYIGIPTTGEIRNIETTGYGIHRNETAYQSHTSNCSNDKIVMREDFSKESASSFDYAFLGDIILINGTKKRVSALVARLYDGILECNYELGLETSFIPPTVINQQAVGRMLSGNVTAVKEDKVQVFLTSVDGSADGSSDWWFPYSTAYSSQDGSGWYAMPEVGDGVRVFFPSDNEADAFAASSVTKNIRPNVKEKCFSGVNGKQILLTEDGLTITCKNGIMHIHMNKSTGIEILSDMNINITSGSKVNIQAEEEIRMTAKNEIMIGTPGAYIDIRPEEIIMSAENIFLK